MFSSITFSMILTVTAGLLTACGSGPCKEVQSQQQSAEIIQAKTPVTELKPTDRVKVYKPDGSLQCGMGKSVPLASMQRELQDIQVFSSVNKPDGLMHIQACGTPTGKCNVYEILRSDLEKARSFGFREWTFD